MSGLRETILVVCADSHLQKILKVSLEKAGYQLLVTSLGKEALELAGSQCPDLIVVDLKLPDLSGLALIRLIRSQEEIQSLPLVVIGASIKDDEMMLALEAGADLCLKEPLQPGVFIARVRALLRRCQVYAHA